MTMKNQARFDGQAQTYDLGRGLSDEICREVVKAVLAVANVGPGDLVVEVGAGTGKISEWFCRHPVRYVGLDISRGMLGVFQRRPGYRESPRSFLALADCSADWPLSPGAAHVIFSSRAIHLLPVEHVVAQLSRVASAKATLVIGRIERQQDSVKARMREEMHRRLSDLGFRGRDGGRQCRRLFDSCRVHGSEVLNSVVASRWTIGNTPEQSIQAWRDKDGLAGIDMPDEIKSRLLDGLRSWAATSFGALDLMLESHEAYVLQSVRLRGPSSS